MSLVLFVEFPSGEITIYQLSLSSQVRLNLKDLTLWFIYKLTSLTAV